MDSFILNASLLLLGIGFVSVIAVILLTMKKREQPKNESQPTHLEAGGRFSEESVLDLIELASYLRVAKLLVGSPKTVTDLSNLTNFTEKEIAEMVVQLQSAGAVETEGSKWRLTSFGKDTLLKRLASDIN